MASLLWRHRHMGQPLAILTSPWPIVPTGIYGRMMLRTPVLQHGASLVYIIKLKQTHVHDKHIKCWNNLWWRSWYFTIDWIVIYKICAALTFTWYSFNKYVYAASAIMIWCNLTWYHTYHCCEWGRTWINGETQKKPHILISQMRYIPVTLPWIFPGAPFIFNGAPGNIQGNLTGVRLCGDYCEDCEEYQLHYKAPLCNPWILFTGTEYHVVLALFEMF